MEHQIAVIGGDLRYIKLVEMFANEGITVYTYGLENADEIKNNKNIVICTNIEETVKHVKTVIAPIPFTKDGIKVNTPFSDKIINISELIANLDKKILIAGSITKEVYSMVNNKQIYLIDIMQKEELAVLNSIATAEGTIEIAISNTEKNIHGSKILILGFGRIGKVLARKFAALSAKITCAARKLQDIAWIETCGYEYININNMKHKLKDFDIIINTVPQIILDKHNLKYVKKECLLIDLASVPGGIDNQACQNENLKLIWALGLPGKVSPITSAKYIKEEISNILKELYID